MSIMNFYKTNLARYLILSIGLVAGCGAVFLRADALGRLHARQETRRVAAAAAAAVRGAQLGGGEEEVVEAVLRALTNVPGGVIRAELLAAGFDREAGRVLRAGGGSVELSGALQVAVARAWRSGDTAVCPPQTRGGPLYAATPLPAAGGRPGRVMLMEFSPAAWHAAVAGHRWTGAGFSAALVLLAGFGGVIARCRRQCRAHAAEVRERRQAEAAHQEAETRYRSVFENMMDCVFIATTEGCILDANPAACRTFASNARQLAGSHLSRLVQHGYQTDFEQLCESAVAGQPQQGEALAVSREGRTFHCDVRVATMRHGNRNCLIALLRDVEEQHAAESALRRERDLNRTIIEATPAYMMTLGRDRRILSANRALTAFLGIGKRELVGTLYTDLMPVADHHDSTSRFRALLDGEQTRGVTELVSAAGERKTVEWFSTPVQLGRGEADFAIAIGVDITERQLAEKRRIELEEQLRQAQKMEAIGTLAGGIAHDFNNILAGILGYTELVSARLPADHPVRGWLAQITKAGERAGDLVAQILTFSRRGELDRRPLHLAPLIKEAMKLLRSALPSTITIDQRIAPDCPPVLADPTQIHQVLMNLCTNGFQAMERGGTLTVSLSCETVDEEAAASDLHLKAGQYACITVADSGVGMDQLTLSRIFDPYFTTKTASNGTGLGLTIVHGIVDKHDGAVRVQSEPGRGAKFRVYLPATVVAAVERPVPGDGRLPRGRGERLLVIDDEAMLLEAGCTHLEQIGYRVVGSASPSEAWQVFRSDPRSFDLVITDLTMPGMTGIDLANRFSALRPDMPVILCSGNADAGLQPTPKTAAIRQFLPKPVPPREMALAIRTALDHAAAV